MRALLFLLALAACAEGPGAALNPHTGVASLASRTVTIDRRRPAHFEVRAVRLSKDGAEAFALLTFVTRSDLNYPRIESAWAGGTTLPYEHIDRRRVGRSRQEAGSIRLTRGVAEAAARAGGLRLQMIGRRGTYGGIVPGAIFGELLAR